MMHGRNGEKNKMAFDSENETVCKNQHQYDELSISERLDVEASFEKWLAECPVSVLPLEQSVNATDYQKQYPSTLRPLVFFIPENLEVEWRISYSLNVTGETEVTADTEENARDIFNNERLDKMRDWIYDWEYDLEIDDIEEA